MGPINYTFDPAVEEIFDELWPHNFLPAETELIEIDIRLVQHYLSTGQYIGRHRARAQAHLEYLHARHEAAARRVA